ncbi:MAG: hypothetical protein IPL31_00195 [Saprospiraceae bacterium]|nr:hypothetical protein [Saprospiraceae bacterium]
MIRICFLVSILLHFCKYSHGQNLIAVQNGSSFTRIFTNLDSAIINSNDKDTLYIPGGNYNLNVPITKELHIIGSGFNLDTSNFEPITSIIGTFRLLNNASNGSITGCYFNLYCYSGCGPTIIIEEYISNYSIRRCFIKSGIKFSVPSDFINVSENIIGSYGSGCLYGGLYSLFVMGNGNVFSNNLLGPVWSQSGSLFKNNIINYCQTFCSAFPNCNGVVFENNIINNCWTPSISNCIFKNNLNWSYTSGVDAQNNQHINNYSLTNIIFDSLFVDFNGNYLKSNMHIKPGLPYFNLGSDGTEVGIYGGQFPWKDGSLPSNPQIQFKQIANSTDQNGNLKINIKVKAQNN